VVKKGERERDKKKESEREIQFSQYVPDDRIKGRKRDRAVNNILVDVPKVPNNYNLFIEKYTLLM
jgi:hypothetical protein